MSFVSDEYLASIKNMMRVVEWWCGVSFVLALFGLVLSIVALLPMWEVATLLLTSLLLWLFTSLGVMRINYRITEINIRRALGIIENLDPDHLEQFIDEFSNKFLSFSTKFRVFSFIELFIMFWGFFNLVFYATVLSHDSISLGPFAAALAFVVPVSVTIIIALGGHYSELIREVYVHPEHPQQLLGLIKSASFTRNSLFAMFIIPLIIIILSLPLILPVTITRSTSILTIACFSSYFALALSELVAAMQWLALALVGRDAAQLLRMANRLKAQGVGSKR